MPDPVLSEVVQQRLELLLSEIEPRHVAAVPDPGSQESAEPDNRAPGPRRAINPAAPDLPEPAAQPESGSRRPEQSKPLAERGRLGGLAQGAVEFGRAHLASILLLLLVAGGWSAYLLFQVRTTPVAVAAPPSVVASATAMPSESASGSASMLVHVIGAVVHPGVVELPAGSRVQDAIEAAGGLRSSADPGELNLAAAVSDGAQIVIGTSKRPAGELREGAAGGGGGSGASGGKVSLNSATLAELDQLPGIGPVTAQKILDWRAANGGFASVSDLQQVDGIGPKTYADLAELVRV